MFGVDRAVLVALGALAAVAYVILLEKTADDVASGKRDTVTKLQGDVRFAIPVALVGAVALRNYLSHPETTGLLNLIPKEDYAAVIFGFVAPSRLPLLYREIRSSLKGDELLDILPGSLGQGRQILKRMGGPSAGAGVTDDNKIGSGSTRILVVSGPKCLGKSTLVEAIMREDDRLAAPAWCTTRPMKQAENDEQDYVQIGQVKFEDIERNAGFLHTYHDEAGESYGLRLEDVLAIAKKGKVTCRFCVNTLRVTLGMRTPLKLAGYSDRLLPLLSDRRKTALFQTISFSRVQGSETVWSARDAVEPDDPTLHAQAEHENPRPHPLSPHNFFF